MKNRPRHMLSLSILIFSQNYTPGIMSKREAILRYSLIINKLRREKSTYKEINEYLAKESEWQGYNFTISERTLERDREDIRSIYNIDIQYDFSNKVYYIAYEENNNSHNRLLEAFDTFNALNLTDRISQNIYFESRKSKGTENLHSLVHAIQKKIQIRFEYLKYYEEYSSYRITNPIALKEYRNIWYLIAFDTNDDKVKSFGLDRLSELEITKQHFTNTTDFNVEKYFEYSFGIIGPDELEEPEEVILSLTPLQGQYVKSMPLHHTQHILIDSKEEFRIKLHLHIKHDFKMEILSMGQYVKIIKPKWLINDIKSTYNKAIKQY